ncbi:MAG: CoA transferase [Ignavibacteriae bacterium HGW-Ignavibacteriae-1]|jgi:formyl-CoA transferase|nr:MAG: CoA transferase [Ignavibacteriae bacterium HGW-Ignavibacteriae-1]
MKILEGILVLDLTNVLSGPFATLHLAWLGAEVIKVENPVGGDLARNLGCVKEYNDMLMGTSFIAQNCNKKSMTLNLKKDKAKEIFIELVRISDIVVENFRPGVMDRLGLGYEELKKHNQKLIYCAISGFGQTGPDANKPAYDQIIQGLSGVMAINGDETLNPLRAGFPVCDTVGGLNAAFAIMSAMYHRERTGEGQFIDVALIDSTMPLLGWVAANLMIGGQEPPLLGNDNFSSAPSGTFKTKDGHINIAANKQEQWEDLADILELSELKDDPRFKIRDHRKKHRFELTPYINEKLQAKETKYWVELLNKSGIPAGEILKLGDALDSPQIRHRNTFTNVEIDGIGTVAAFNSTAKFSKTESNVTKAPPKLSEHTREILSLIGLNDEDASKLKSEDVI